MADICAGKTEDHHEMLNNIECEGDHVAIKKTETYCIEKSPFVTTWWTLDAEQKAVLKEKETHTQELVNAICTEQYFKCMAETG